MNYSLPFNDLDKVIEFGGGTQPQFHPNVDTRSGPNVDLVMDLEKSLPIKDCIYDGVYSRYLIEHLSWRTVRAFLKEVARILKPDGRAVFIAPNLYEQAKKLVALEKTGWTDENVCMIFGDQDYPENTHKAGFSPEFAFKMLREAGFRDIMISPHPATVTDMIIEAKKAPVVEIPKVAVSVTPPGSWTADERQAAFGREYFDGGKGGLGGYTGEGYWDHPVHWSVYNHVKNLKPKSVFEIGCGRGYILKRLQDDGIGCNGIDISRHCYETRAMDNVHLHDILEMPWRVLEKSYDLLLSVNVLEHLPEGELPKVFSEMTRVASRGLHAVEVSDDGTDKTRCTIRPLSWWKERLPEGHIVVEKKDLYTFPVQLPEADKKVKLNIGSFTTMFHHGWINIDIENLGDWAKKHSYRFEQWDATLGIPFKEGVVDMIYSSHFLEHLTYTQGADFLKECHRLMKVGGRIRLILPDTQLVTQDYRNENLGVFDELNEGCAESKTQARKLWSLLVTGHQSLYDMDTIVRALGDAGFSTVEPYRFRESGSPEMLRETLDMLPGISLYVEAVK